MTRRCLALLALAALLAAVSPAQAQKPTLDSRIDVRVEATPAAEVFRQIISGLGYDLQLDASLAAPVTLWVTHVSARTALNVVCESVGCTWRVVGSRLVVSQGDSPAAASSGLFARVGRAEKTEAGKPKTMALDLGARFKRPLPVDMQFQDVPVSTILRAMSEVSGLEITADEPLASQHVTLTGSGHTVEDALMAVIKQAGSEGAAMFMVRDRGNSAAPEMKIAIKARPVAKDKK